MKQPKIRRFRYSLKALLILQTLLCLWLGRQVYVAHSQRRAVEAIEAAGGRVSFDHQTDGRGTTFKNERPPGPLWLQDLIGEHYFKRVVTVGFHEPDLTDADLERLAPHLRRLVKLRSFSITQTSVTDAGLRHLVGLKRLERLELSARVQGAGLVYLQALPKLEFISSWNSDLSDVGLRNLSALRQLQRLSIVNTEITDEGLVYLGSLRRLESLELSDWNVTDVGLRHLEALTSLKKLKLRCENVTDAGLHSLLKLTQLEELSLCRSALTEELRAKVFSLDMGGRLWFGVELSRSQFAAADIGYLEALPNLQRVVVNEYQLDEAGRFLRKMQ